MTADRIWWHVDKETRRLWFHWGRTVLGFEIGRPCFHMAFGVSSDGENTIHGDFCGFYWQLDSWQLAKRLPRCANAFRFYWHEAGLWLTFWGNDWESSARDPWWRKMWHLDFPDLLLGKAKYSKVVLETFNQVIIPMPEGLFSATMSFEVCTWKRPRWFADVRKYTNISLEKAPSFPGKGENSWDCGDDAIYGCSSLGHSLPNAIGDYVRRVFEYREKRSGRKSLFLKEYDAKN